MVYNLKISYDVIVEPLLSQPGQKYNIEYI